MEVEEEYVQVSELLTRSLGVMAFALSEAV